MSESMFKPTFAEYTGSYVHMATKRTLFFTEEFAEDSCSELTAMLMYLDLKGSDIITLYINSPGGLTKSLYSVLNTMNIIKSPIRTICIGEASSCGAVLLSAGTVGERYATETSQIMIHGITAGIPRWGGAAHETPGLLKYIKDHNDDIIKILAKNCNQPFKKVKEDCKIDNYMSAKEAKKYGLIDKIV